MQLPMTKYYQEEKEKLEESYDVFSRSFFEKYLLVFLSLLGKLYEVYERKGNKKEMMLAYVHGFRAILAIGIALNAKEDLLVQTIQMKGKTVESLLFDLYAQVSVLRKDLKDETFYKLFSLYMVLGDCLGFNFDDVTYVYETEMEE